MNYELAKKLKDAGFPPVLRDGSFIIDSDEFIFAIGDARYIGGSVYDGGCGCCSGPVTGADWVKLPTLSELIEACQNSGDYYGFNLNWLREYEGRWEAQLSSLADRPIATGKTPEEAVANLWLALNKK